jgi:hypothetical protein
VQGPVPLETVPLYLIGMASMLAEFLLSTFAFGVSAEINIIFKL